MVKISYPQNDVYRKYGVRHFEEKYKIGIEPEDGAGARIKVAANHILPYIGSRAETGYGVIPFFEDLGGKPPVEKLDDKVVVNFDVFNEVGRILSGHLESVSPDVKDELMHIPLVDIYEKILLDAITLADEGESLKHARLWPGGKKFAVCLTHDVDETRKTYQYLTRPLRHIKRGEYARAVSGAGSFFTDKVSGKRPYWTFEDIMALEERLGVRSTFYFLQEDGKIRLHKPGTYKLYARRYRFDEPRVRDIISGLRSGAWEVGLHGSYYSYLSREKLASEKKELEAVLGEKITGTRQHHLNLKIPDTWDHQDKAGMAYDTSLGFKDRTGFRWGTCFPFHPLDAAGGRTLPLLELPLIIMDTPLFTSKSNIWQEIAGLIDVVEKQNGLLTILFHHAVFNAREYPGWAEIYERVIRLCLEKNAWVTNAENINQWWRSRQNAA